MTLGYKPHPFIMSRARSKTVDSAEVKKKGIPRRLNEKIALIKEKEQAQSEAFEQAMKSIFEVWTDGWMNGSMIDEWINDG